MVNLTTGKIKINSGKFRTGGAGTTPTPPVDWANSDFIGNNGTYIPTEQQITGIKRPITLKFTYEGTLWVGNKFYYKIGSESAGGDFTDPSLAGYTEMEITDGQFIFTVNNDDFVGFAYGGNGTAETLYVTIVNASDNNKILDTFDAFYTFNE